tara:strand:- start:250 stop:441 length:192 start_codon:yes stop_codon:yes gene_type:complete
VVAELIPQLVQPLELLVKVLLAVLVVVDRQDGVTVAAVVLVRLVKMDLVVQAVMVDLELQVRL